MIKKFVLAITLVTILMMSTLSFALDFEVNENWQAAAISGVVFKADDANSQFSGGIFVGPIINLKSAAGKNVFGMGGLIGNIKADEDGVIKGAIGLTAVTAFNNTVQISVVADPTDFKWIDPDSYMMAVTVNPVDVFNTLGNGVSALFGMISGYK